ncbi:Gfo/Idh/MocA family protein [Halosolutus halophilus]|uniref:Gfo/Idh/MocA family protein n=1 Tax=Halosolutus halophilus TaxID=1552990 RepID=UPI0022350843|nr:Gfo/Idh/MocA family oxidoreductase [Halosolutus halophilus]
MQFGAAAIGLGGLGQLELEILAGLDGVDVIAGVDVSSDARTVFEREFDVPAYAESTDMLADHGDEIDVALIVTPHTLHYEQARACLAADVHVYLEKPMVTDVSDAVDLIDRADRNDLVVQVGYQRHFHPGFTEVKRLVDSGRIGRIHAANAAIGQNWIDLHQGTWRVDPSLSGGGQLYDTGSHLLDALLWLTDADPSHVSATIEYASPGVDVNSALSVQLDRDDQQVIAGVTISGNGVQLAPFENYSLWGTNGRITFDGERIRLAERDAAVYESIIEAQTDFASLTTAKLQNFLDSIEGTAEPEVPGTVGLSVTALTEAAYEAADTDSRVDVQALIDDAS